MIFDKTKQKLNELEKECQKAITSSEKARIEKRIERYKRKGDDWYVRFPDSNGKYHSEKVPPQYRGKRGAEKYEKIRTASAERGEYCDKNLRNASIEQISDFYLDSKMKRKASYSAAKTLCKHIKNHIGSVRLQRLNNDPEYLIDFFNDFPESEWSQKYIWNYRATLRAAIAHWLKFKRVIMANPVDLVEIKQGTKVIDYVPTKLDFESIIVASFTVGLPDVIRNLYIAVYETGLRIGEILGWQIEELSLKAPVFNSDGRATEVPYYSTSISKQQN